MKVLRNYINGQFQDASKGGTIELIDPSKNIVYGTAPDSGEEDVLNAINAAKSAFPIWSSMSIEKRNHYLNKIADLIDEKADMLAKAESLDNGKPIKLAARVDIPRASSNMRFFTNAILQFNGENYLMADGSVNYTVRDPLGVVSCISPWNLPLYLFTWKIAPALAAGNTVVAKPSEVTPLTAFLFTEICKEAGLPDGVLNVVHGYGHTLGNSLVKHDTIKAISFTGSTRTGGIIAQSAAALFKKVSLEMGGKNPNIIFADCDYDKMLATTLHSSFANQGEICLCGSRILVEESIYDQFLNDFVAKTKALKVGPPDLSSSKIGAIVSEDHYNKIRSYVQLAQEEGGRIECGGTRPDDLPETHQQGFYLLPTIITGLDQQCRTNQEEIFGPVVTVESFKTETEALEKANATKYGLSASLWTSNVHRAHRFSRSLESGIVWVNTWLKRDLRTPFGGVKQSGVGREGGFDALRFFTEVKNICIQVNTDEAL